MNMQDLTVTLTEAHKKLCKSYVSLKAFTSFNMIFGTKLTYTPSTKNSCYLKQV